MIRQRERRHLQFDGAADQVVEPVRTVEERVFAVGVQMYERHVLLLPLRTACLRT